MKVIRITTTKTAQERNENALYNLDYTITDGLLERVLATIYSPDSELESEEAPVFSGTITYENGQVFCALPGDASITDLMNDFGQFLTQIRTTVLEENKDKKN